MTTYILYDALFCYADLSVVGPGDIIGVFSSADEAKQYAEDIGIGHYFLRKEETGLLFKRAFELACEAYADAIKSADLAVIEHVVLKMAIEKIDKEDKNELSKKV